MLPLAALLNGLGIVMIYRLQESGRDGNPGSVISTMSTSTTALQVVWSAVGDGGVRRRARRSSGSRARCSATPTRWARSAWCCWPSRPCCPTRSSEVERRQGVDQRSAASPSSPASSPSWRWPCSSPATWSTKRDVLVAGRAAGARHRPAPRARPGPGAHRLGRQPAHPGLRDRHRPRPRCSSACSWSCCTSPPSARPGCSSACCLFVVGAYVASKLFGHVGDRFTIWLHPFAAQVTCTPSCSTSWCRACTGWASAASSAPGSGTASRTWTPLVQSDFIITAFGEELGLTGLMAMLLIYGLIVQRGCGRRSRSATRSPSCWPAGSRSCSRCRSSSSSAGSPG